MKKIRTLETLNTETGLVESRVRVNNPRTKIAAGVLAVSAILGSHYGLDKAEEYLDHIKHVNTQYDDFGKYEIGSRPEDLAKILEKRGMTEKDITIYTVKNEMTAEQVAKEMGIDNWGEVGRELISPQVNDPNSKTRWTMHSGQTVVVPNDLFDK